MESGQPHGLFQVARKSKSKLMSSGTKARCLMQDLTSGQLEGFLAPG